LLDWQRGIRDARLAAYSVLDFNVLIMADWVSDMTAPLRFVVVIGVSFSLLAVLLAFAGVYALTADLSQRAILEIGIRKALGATTAETIGLYMLRAARPAIPALIAGALVGVAVLRVLGSQVENVDASQMWVAFVVVGFFGALIAVSTLLASRSAARVNPAVSMRAE
jgi:putative ABC transport system permease protein